MTVEIDRTIRGLSPFPGAWTVVDGKRVKLLAHLRRGGGGPARYSPARRGRLPAGRVRFPLIEVQPEGKGPMSAEDWLRGARLRPGTLVGDA